MRTPSLYERTFTLSLLAGLGLLSACAPRAVTAGATAAAPVATTADGKSASSAASGATSPATVYATQLPASAPREGRKPYVDRWYSNSVLYEVMVRSFFDSDGDGIGDLKGLTAKLDYLNTGDPRSTSDLKIDALWLMPIFKSPSYHGYDATDYYQIDPVYGTMDDFKTFLQEAHKRHIKVLLDLVLNHTSNQHPWFQQSGKGPASPLRSWYVWGKSDPGWERPWGGGPVWHKRGDDYYYGLFWEGMPDLNFNEPAVREEMTKIARYWVDLGVDGYRLDAIRYLFEEGKGKQADLPSTHAWLKELSATLHAQNPEVMLVGEAWTDTSIVKDYYGHGDELDLAFGFDESAGILNAVKSGHGGELVEALNKVKGAYLERRFSAPFLTNHDMPRLATLLDSDPARLRLAFATLMGLPGSPFLYQGEEMGLTNGPRQGDEGKRTPMQWDGGPEAGFTVSGHPWNELSGHQDKVSVAAQEADPDSLLSYYKRLIRQRHASAALRSGEISSAQLLKDGAGAVVSFARTAPGEVVICLYNYGDKEVTTSIQVETSWLDQAQIVGVASTGLDLFTGKPVPLSPASDGMLRLSSVTLPAQSATWIRLAP